MEKDTTGHVINSVRSFSGFEQMNARALRRPAPPGCPATPMAPEGQPSRNRRLSSPVGTTAGIVLELREAPSPSRGVARLTHAATRLPSS